MTYPKARQRLYSLEHWGIKLGLDNIRELCAVLGDPQSRFASIHIAGTNGKGSTSAYLDSILRAAGYRVGRYTSPHLRDFRERIHIDGRPIPAPWVSEFVERHWKRIVAKKYSYFEVTTALAFDAFARAGVDLAVVEVGLGGRFDATNIIEPLACIITRIARDHEHVLGHTPGKIAFEKAGIIKRGVPVVIGPMVVGAEKRIRKIADTRSAPLWTTAELLLSVSRRRVSSNAIPRLHVPLAGDHQKSNLAIAVASAQMLNAFGLNVSVQSIRDGVSHTHWPARFQRDRGAPTVIFDAAHNPDGAKALAQTWRQVYGRQQCVCVFNTRPDKNHIEMFDSLVPIVSEWVFCPMPDSPYIGRDELTRLAELYGRTYHWKEAPKSALAAARSIAGARRLVLVTGSHYLIGAVIPHRLMSPSRASGRHSVTAAQLVAAAQDRGAPF